MTLSRRTAAGGLALVVVLATTLTTTLTVTLTAGGRPVGTVALFAGKANAYSADDAGLLDVLANQTTHAIQLLRASEDAARRRIEGMVEAMADGVLLTDERKDASLEAHHRPHERVEAHQDRELRRVRAQSETERHAVLSASPRRLVATISAW